MYSTFSPDHLSLRQIAATWANINDTRLSGRLKPPQFEIDRATRRLGRWDPLTRTIGISASHLQEAEHWLEVALTIRHEMAHQVVSELFLAPNAQPHGELFRRAEQMLDLPGSPRLCVELEPEVEKVMSRVRKLLALAESDNVHEAEAAMAQANQLLLQHNLKHLSTPSPEVGWRWLGPLSYRITLERKLVSSILSEFYFVECIWVRSFDPRLPSKRGSTLEIIGRPHNLDLAEYVHDYLHRVLDTLWGGYRRAHPYAKGAKVKRDFRVGVLMGFRQHLHAASNVQRAEGLVWAGDPAAQELFWGRHPQVKNLPTSRYRNSETHRDGLKAGQALRIRPGVGQGAANRGRQLGGKRR